MQPDCKNKVSILIPCYNSEKYLAEAINSAINQNWPNLEIIISDNHSSDHSIEIAKRYAKQDSRIRVIENNRNLGPARNWLNLAKSAQGDIVALLFSDDILDPDYLKFLVPSLNEPDVGFAFSSAWMIDEFNRTLGSNPMYYSSTSGILSANLFIDGHLFLGSDFYPVSPGCAVFRKKDMLEALSHSFNDEFDLGFSEHGAGPDLGIYLLTAMKYPYFFYVNKSLAKFRAHENNLSKLEKVKISYAIVKSQIASMYCQGNYMNLSKFRSAHFLRLFRLGKLSLYLKTMRWDKNPLGLNMGDLIRYLSDRLLQKHSEANRICNQSSTLYQKLSVVNALTIPGYLKTVPPETIGQLDFFKRDARIWYQDFVNRAALAQGQHFLPIYRMADGEFIFNVGRRTPIIMHKYKLYGYIKYIAQTIRIKIRHIFLNSETTCWGENYPKNNIDILKKDYLNSVKFVSSFGYLAIHFNRTEGRFSEEYIKPMCKWFDQSGIAVTVKNYIPFYFIYALLCGPDSDIFIRNKKILVITSADSQKREKISESLKFLGAHSVAHIGISRNNAMNDEINIGEPPKKYDLILVAAGIGSVSILAQLRMSNTLCIDAGIFVEILANPDNRNRIFTVPDGLK